MAKLCLGPYDLPGAPVADAVHAGAGVAWGSTVGRRFMVHESYCSLKDLVVDAENVSYSQYFLKLFDMYLGGNVIHYLIIDNSVFSTLSAGSQPASSYLM